MPAAFGFVVNERNEILLIQRGYGSRKGKWSLPGGTRTRGDPAERPYSDTRREQLLGKRRREVIDWAGHGTTRESS